MKTYIKLLLLICGLTRLANAQSNDVKTVDIAINGLFSADSSSLKPPDVRQNVDDFIYEDSFYPFVLYSNAVGTQFMRLYIRYGSGSSRYFEIGYSDAKVPSVTLLESAFVTNRGIRLGMSITEFNKAPHAYQRSKTKTGDKFLIEYVHEDSAVGTYRAWYLFTNSKLTRFAFGFMAESNAPVLKLDKCKH